MNKNIFNKYLLMQAACLLSIFAVIFYYLYQEPEPTLADQATVWSAGLRDAGIEEINHRYKNARLDDDRSLDIHTLEKKFDTGTVRINIVEDRLAHSVFSIRRQARTVVVEGAVEPPDLGAAAAFVNTVLKTGYSAAPRKTNVVFSGAEIY